APANKPDARTAPPARAREALQTEARFGSLASPNLRLLDLARGTPRFLRFAHCSRSPKISGRAGWRLRRGRGEAVAFGAPSRRHRRLQRRDTHHGPPGMGGSPSQGLIEPGAKPPAQGRDPKSGSSAPRSAGLRPRLSQEAMMRFHTGQHHRSHALTVRPTIDIQWLVVGHVAVSAEPLIRLRLRNLSPATHPTDRPV